MSVMPAGDNEDWKKCELIGETIEKLMQQREDGQPAVEIAWMTADLAMKIANAQYAAYTSIFMAGLRQGMPEPEAKENAQRQVPLLVFQLGMLVGTEIEAGRAFREMFGDGGLA